MNLVLNPDYPLFQVHQKDLLAAASPRFERPVLAKIEADFLAKNRGRLSSCVNSIVDEAQT